MRILILSYEFPPLGGGAGNATAELVRALGEYPDLEVVVVTSSVGNYYVERQKFSSNSTIYYLPIGKKNGNLHYQTDAELLRFNVRCFWFLRKLLAKESFDVCHAVMTLPGGFNAWLIKRHVPYIVSLQGSDVPWYSERFELVYHVLTPIICRIWKDSKSVVSNSFALRELAMKSAPDQKIEVITNGIDRDVFRPFAVARKGELRVICVGRLIYRKGVVELVDAMKTVRARVPNARLDLVGSGILEPELREQIRSLGLQDCVTLHGSVPHDELPSLLNRASLFALPSHAEGMSNALLEGIACGLPIVTTDTGGTTELLDGNGLIVPMKEPAALADAITTMLSDEQKLADAARASLAVADKYSWQVMADRYIELYREAVRRELPIFRRRGVPKLTVAASGSGLQSPEPEAAGSVRFGADLRRTNRRRVRDRRGGVPVSRRR